MIRNFYHRPAERIWVVLRYMDGRQHVKPVTVSSATELAHPRATRFERAPAGELECISVIGRDRTFKHDFPAALGAYISDDETSVIVSFQSQA